jgi:hypothetical protein
MKRRTGVDLQWRHIHGTGIGYVIGDMDSKQCGGKLIY